MPSLPPLDIKRKINHAPHLVILGAGASLAAFPNGEANGRKLPLMRNIVEAVGLGDLLAAHGVHENHEDFEALYDSLATNNANPELLRTIEDPNWCRCVWTVPIERTLNGALTDKRRSPDIWNGQADGLQWPKICQPG